MADIRLKQLTIDPLSATLDIKNGNIYIHNTNESSSALSGCIVALGGIGIAQTSLAVSPVNGGALTIKGGIGIGKNMFIEGDVSQEAPTSTFTVKGTITPRFFIDTESNAKIRLAPNGDDVAFTASDFDVTINTTRVSTNASTGSLISLGGLAVASNENATSFTSGGGALSVAGGGNIEKNFFIGGLGYIKGDGTTASLSLGPLNHATSGNFASVLSSKTTTGNSSILELLTHASSTSAFATLAMSISPTQNVTCHSTVESTTSTDGSLVSLGGLGIAKSANISGIIKSFNTTEATNIGTAAIVTLGGIGVARDAFIGQSLNVLSNTKVSGVIAIDELVTRGNKLTLFQTDGNLSEQVEFCGLGVLDVSNLVYQVPLSSAHVFNVSSNEELRVSSNGIQLRGDSQKYTISGAGSGLYNLTFQGNESGRDSTVEFYTADGDSTDNNTIVLFNKGTSTINANSESLALGWDASRMQQVVKTVKSGTGALRPLSIEVGGVDQLLLSTNGNVSFSGGTVSIFNTEANSLIVLGGASITKGLILNGMTISNIKTGTTINNLILSNSSLVAQSGNPTFSLQNVGLFNATDTESLVITTNTVATTISTAKTGTGVLRPIILGVSPQMHLATNGNVSINSLGPNSATLHVNGSANFLGSVSMGSLAIAAVVATSTTDSVSTTTGSVVGFGGLGIAKSAYIGGPMNLNYTNGNSLVALGGATIGLDLVVSGDASIGNIEMNNATCFNIVSTSTVESTSTTSGSVVIGGGLGINKKLNIGSVINANDHINIINNSTGSLSGLHLKSVDAIDRFSFEQDDIIMTLSRYDESGVVIDTPLQVEITTGNVELTNAVTVQGNISVNSIVDTSSTASGSIVTLGGVGIAKSLTVGQVLKVQGMTDSSDINTGALIVDGGAGIEKNLYVGGNAVITGDLIVNGTTTTIKSVVTELDDNVLVVNSGASGSRDAGILFSRYQTVNNTGLGDVVADTEYVQNTLPDQTGMAITQVKFSSAASSSDDYYTGWYIKVSSGFSSNQVRKITGYVGSSKIATVTAWDTQGPAISDTVNLYYKPFVGLFYNELDDVFQLSACIQDPGFTNVSTTQYMGLKTRNIEITGTAASVNSSTGTLVLLGGVGINNTTDATSATNGGSLTVGGGTSIAKNLIVGGTFTVNGVQIAKGLATVVFVGANNQATPVDVTGALMSSSLYGVEIFLSIRVVATSSVYTNFHLRLVNRDTSWELNSSYVGDDSGIMFSITAGGQIQYTSPNFTGFTSLTMRYSVVEN